jgi:hypothetical protein
MTERNNSADAITIISMLKKNIPFTTALLFLLASLSYADQYVVTQVFDGNTISLTATPSWRAVFEKKS